MKKLILFILLGGLTVIGFSQSYTTSVSVYYAGTTCIYNVNTSSSGGVYIPKINSKSKRDAKRTEEYYQRFKQENPEGYKRYMKSWENYKNTYNSKKSHSLVDSLNYNLTEYHYTHSSAKTYSNFLKARQTYSNSTIQSNTYKKDDSMSISEVQNRVSKLKTHFIGAGL